VIISTNLFFIIFAKYKDIYLIEEYMHELLYLTKFKHKKTPTDVGV